MAMTAGQQILADFLINIGVNVKADVQFILGAIQRQFAQLGEQLKTAGKAAETWAQGFQASVGLASKALVGFITAGVALSAQGQQISLGFQQLSLQIAGLFTPEINTVIGLLQRAVAWFRNLSGAQQDSLAFWGKLLLAATGMAYAVPKVTAVIEGLGVALKAANAISLTALLNPWVLLAAAILLVLMHSKAFREMLMEIGPAIEQAFRDAVNFAKTLAQAIDEIAANIKNLIGLFIDLDNATPSYIKRQAEDPLGFAYSRALYGQKAGTLLGPTPLGNVPSLGYKLGLYGAPEGYHEEMRRRKEEQDKRQRHDLMPRMGGFETLEGTWQRISIATRNATAGVKTTEQRQLEATETVARNTTELNERDRNRQPPNVR